MKLHGPSILLAATLWCLSGPVFAQATTAAPAVDSTTETAASPDANAFATDQLEQLVAPIALYPDALLMQILMAATYPLEIVEANRFVDQNPDLTGEALETALLDKDWDPSVKSLCTLPSVLDQMSENLDWTQDLGDAFLGQQNDLLDTVQRMRGLAYDAGNLKSSEQQVVTQEPDQIIVIQSAQPEVVYVPTYSSTVVYGSAWGYPSYYYPPMYYPPPPGYGFISFSIGVAVGAAIWGNCNWGWGNNNVNINVNRYNEFNRTTNINADRDRIQGGGRDGNSAGWQHDASHRKGVNYKSPEVAQRNGANAGSTRVSKDQARGYSGAGTNRATAGTSQAANRPSASTGQRSTQADRSAAGASNRSTPSNSNRSAPSSNNRSSNSAYSGSRSPSFDSRSSSRGAASRGATSYGGARGGARAGGGRRR